jgi:hypothetical protein
MKQLGQEFDDKIQEETSRLEAEHIPSHLHAYLMPTYATGV